MWIMNNVLYNMLLSDVAYIYLYRIEEKSLKTEVPLLFPLRIQFVYRPDCTMNIVENKGLEAMWWYDGMIY